MDMLKIGVMVTGLLLGACAGSNGHSPTSGMKDYRIISGELESGKTLYLIACDNGTSTCGYDWDALCVTGTAKNAGPFGNVSPTPGYMQGMRLFVCE